MTVAWSGLSGRLATCAGKPSAALPATGTALDAITPPGTRSIASRASRRRNDGAIADDVGMLLFVVAILLVDMAGWRWVRERGKTEDAPPGRGLSTERQPGETPLPDRASLKEVGGPAPSWPCRHSKTFKEVHR